MSARIPSRRWTLVLWAHFALALAATLFAIVRVACDIVLDPSIGDAVNAWNVLAVAWTMIMIFGQLVAEWGLLRQRAIGDRGFWRVLFALWAIATALGVAYTLFIAIFWGISLAYSSDELVEFVSSAIGLGQLFVVGWYAWASDHLWRPLRETATV